MKNKSKIKNRINSSFIFNIRNFEIPKNRRFYISSIFLGFLKLPLLVENEISLRKHPNFMFTLKISKNNFQNVKLFRLNSYGI